MKIPRIILPKEHGAWAVLLIPMFVAVLITQTFSLDMLFLLLSALLAFMSYPPLHAVLREYSGTPQGRMKYFQSKFWAIVYVALSIVFVIPILADGYRNIIPIALLGAVALVGNYFLTIRYPKTIPSDLFAVFGLTLSGPASYYVLKGSYDQTAFMLWILNVLFFGSCVFYVHMKIRAASLKKYNWSLLEKLRLGKYTIVYHFFALSVVAFFGIRHVAPQPGLLAFMPITLQAFYGTLRLSSRVQFKRLGYLLIAHSILFGIILGIAK